MGTLRIVRQLLLLAAGLAGAATAHAEVYACVGPGGEKTVQDTPCPVAPVAAPRPLPPLACTLSAEALRRAVHLETQFLRRFPDDDSHRRAQLGALQAVVAKLRRADARLAELQPERKLIAAEREFHKNGALSPTWQARAEANDGAFAGLADTYRRLEQEIVGVQSHYVCERATLGKMWLPESAPGSSACEPPTCAPA